MREANLAAKGLKSRITADGVGAPQAYPKGSNADVLASNHPAPE
jgi:hypothetical protein